MPNAIHKKHKCHHKYDLWSINVATLYATIVQYENTVDP
jgi:hypothetical protein